MSTNGSELPALSAEDQAALDAQRTAETADVKAGQHPVLNAATVKPEAADPAKAEPAKAEPAKADANADLPEGARPADDGKHYVPVETLVNTRKTLQGQVNDMKAVLEATQAQLAAATKLLNGQQGAQQPKATEQPAEKNPYEKALNPLEHAEWELAQVNKRLEGVMAKLGERDTRETQALQLQQQQGLYVQHHERFAASNPAYNDAYNWLTSRMVGMHKAMGYDAATANQMAMQTEWQTVVQAVQRNQDPCAVLWNMAKELGYTPQPGAAPANANQPGQKTGMDKIKFTNDAAAAAVSLSGVPGGPAHNVDAAALANMSKEEFAAFFAGDAGGKKWEKIAMGM